MVSTSLRDPSEIHYAWDMDDPSSLSARGVPVAQFSQWSMLWCHKGGRPTLRHNEIRDFRAELLKEQSSNVSTEPIFQPLHDERFQFRSANREDEGRLDVRASEFGVRNRRPFLTLGFSLQLPSLISRRILLLCIVCTNRRKDNMRKGCKKLRREPSHLWSLLLLEVWQGSVPFFQKNCWNSLWQEADSLFADHVLD